jgi:hypothetical protein
MSSENETEGLVVSSATVPVLRGGFANYILLLLGVGVVLGNRALIDAGTPGWLRWMGLVAFASLALKTYLCAVARLYVRGGRTLVLVSPVSERTIEASEIVSIRVFGLSPWKLICVSVRTTSSRWPTVGHFVANATNRGSYSETKAHLGGRLARWLDEARSHTIS